ncbi:hypothetical protein, partial [Alloprevotella tannerae]|uniref:hypothetical protein n=1 Tax=Alloprevotella tannerae TaxID=76122 RepID=UPI003609B8A2
KRPVDPRAALALRTGSKCQAWAAEFCSFTNPERHYFCPSFLFSNGERRCRMAFLAAGETKLGTFLAKLRKK